MNASLHKAKPVYEIETFLNHSTPCQHTWLHR